ncbi:MAG: family 43 glycosylhydrolase [Clostridia bacterium]|nr:family 43 glycosylhydrolase [Clostridia bacterium]
MRRDEINIRDPFVLTDGGKYYLYGTRGATCWGTANGFDVYVSDNLENWDGPFVCFENDGSFWADRNYWAPEVHVYKGAYYMFASFKNETVRRGTAILKAETPMGPFVPHSNGCITPKDWECLDGTFYVDKKGTPYMVFCHEWVQAGDGEVDAVKLTNDLTAPDGEPRLLFHASDAAWCKVMHHSSGVSGCVTDGPFMWRCEDGSLLCLWASFSEGGYTQAVALSDNGDIDGNFTQIDPLFMDDGGHGMVFKGLDGKLYLTLHSPNAHLEERPYFYEIFERNGRLFRK